MTPCQPISKKLVEKTSLLGQMLRGEKTPPEPFSTLPSHTPHDDPDMFYCMFFVCFVKFVSTWLIFRTEFHWMITSLYWKLLYINFLPLEHSNVFFPLYEGFWAKFCKTSQVWTTWTEKANSQMRYDLLKKTRIIKWFFWKQIITVSKLSFVSIGIFTISGPLIWQLLIWDTVTEVKQNTNGVL